MLFSLPKDIIQLIIDDYIHDPNPFGFAKLICRFRATTTLFDGFVFPNTSKQKVAIENAIKDITHVKSDKTSDKSISVIIPSFVKSRKCWHDFLRFCPPELYPVKFYKWKKVEMIMKFDGMRWSIMYSENVSGPCVSTGFLYSDDYIKEKLMFLTYCGVGYFAGIFGVD